MGDSFTSTLKEFEKIVAEITATQERLRFLEWDRDRLRKELRAFAAGGEGVRAISFADTRALRSPSMQPTRSMLELQEALRRMGGEGTSKSIADQMDLPLKTVATRLQRAVERKVLERTAHGLYKLPDENIVQMVEENELEDVPPSDEQSQELNLNESI